jgi:hypothetical protein
MENFHNNGMAPHHSNGRERITSGLLICKESGGLINA